MAEFERCMDPSCWHYTNRFPGAGVRPPYHCHVVPPKSFMGRKEWRCFHCDEVFTDKTEAAMHFGLKDFDAPGCKLNEAEGGLLRIVREQALELDRYRGEDTELMRQLYAAGGEAQRRFQEGEELGYKRGLGDLASTLKTIYKRVVTHVTEHRWECAVCNHVGKVDGHYPDCPIKGYDT